MAYLSAKPRHGTQKKDSEDESLRKCSSKTNKYLPKKSAPKSHLPKIPAGKKYKEEELDENGMPLGYRTCGICRLMVGHNARSCPERNNPLFNSAKPRTIRKRFCKMCNKMAGHNSLTCPLLDVAAAIIAKKKGTKGRNTSRKSRRKQMIESDEEEEDKDEEEEEEDENEQEENDEEEEEYEDQEEDEGEEHDDDEEEPTLPQLAKPPRRSGRKR